MKVRILGCGPSNGVPSLTLGYGGCNPNEARNNRTRSAAIVYGDDGKNILIDAGPEIRLQLIWAGNPHIDAVLLTHAHYDHIGGMDDLRFLVKGKENPLDVYASEQNASILERNFGYLLKNNVINMRIIKPMQAFEIGATHIIPIAQQHGEMVSLGYRLNNFAYTTDAKTMRTEGFDALKGVDVLTLGVVSPAGNYKHISYSEALEWIEKIKPNKTYLTHMGHRMDYGTLCQTLPQGVFPAYDGLEIEINEKGRGNES